jgi:pimeloyl-ACP methyl ester carboxylesterase
LELRAVRVQDPDTEVVLDFAQRIELATPSLPERFGLATGGGGWSGLSGPPVPIDAVPYVPALMLVHGYCSSGSIWPPADFRQPVLEFLDPQQNRTHDQFAQLIAQRAVGAGLSSFGVVAHSQGGPAALHLLTYYPSGLDLARGGRRIQSLASPYQGTPLASLGFFACGVNNNLTPSGAALWLAGIPSWARTEVSTFTTSNSGSACNFFTNLLLLDPEDGTVEQFRAALPGSHDLGHTLGWCHTTGMSQPASYTDHARNLAMDAAAAR